MVWKFKMQGQEVEHFLIGTMHIGCEASYTFSDLARQAISNCQLYIAEMDLDLAATSDIASAYLLPNGSTLHDYLSPRHVARLGLILDKSFGLVLRNYEQLRPILLLNQLSSGILQEGRLDPLDQYLWQYARSLDKTRGGLETVEEQRNLLYAIDLDVQFRQLKNALRNVRYFRKITRKTAELYRLGRYQQLYQTTAKSMGALRHTLIYNRNHNMISRLLTSISDQPQVAHTVAVGAGHIGGNSGLRAGLLRAGYVVKRVSIAKS